jgi:hypothetical protein
MKWNKIKLNLIKFPNSHDPFLHRLKYPLCTYTHNISN